MESNLPARAGVLEKDGQLSANADDQLGTVQLQAQIGQSRHLTLEEHYQLQRFHWRHWYGFHTVWNALTGEVVESYRVDRDLHEAEPNGAKIVHVNTRYKPSGKICNEPWIYGPESSKPDGVGHPASTEIVSHQVPSGDSAWHAKEVPDGPGKGFIVELFFLMPGNESRASVLVAYDRQTHEAKSLLCQREDTWDEHEKPISWSRSTELLKERPAPSETLTGPEEIVTADLLLIEGPGTWKGFEQPVGEALPGGQVPSSEYKLVHLPDGLSVYFPVQVKAGSGSLHISGHLVRDEGVHSISVLYGAKGGFDSLRSARYIVETS